MVSVLLSFCLKMSLSRKNTYLFNSNTYIVLCVFWTFIVFTLLLMPASSFSSAPKLPFLAFLKLPHMDKVVHFIMFAIEAWLIYRSIELKNHLNNKHLAAITIVFISLMGLTTEILQGLTYNTQKRMFSLLDLFFDILASVCVVLILNLVSRKQTQGRKN